MSVDMGQADRTLRSNPKQTDDGVFARHRARVQTLTENPRLFNASGNEITVGDVVRFNGKPCYVEFIGHTFVTITTMDERKYTMNIKPEQINCVVQKEVTT